MKKFVLSLFLTTHIFAFGGLGIYGGSNHHSSTAPGSVVGNPEATITPGLMSNSAGLGFFVYLDVIPVIDLEASWEIVGASYPVLGSVVSDDGQIQITTWDFPWARISGYYTVRKKIVGAGIPFLAKAQFYGGAGFNTHNMIADVTADKIVNAFPEFVSTAEVPTVFDQDFSDQTVINTLTDHLWKYNRTTTGFHVQAGAQAKLLFVNLFINARYTVAKDVVYDTSGFSTIWMGLAIGL